MTKQLTSKDFYYCYNKSKKDYLIKIGIRHITIAKSVKDDKVFWLYQKTDELLNALDEYREHFKD